MKINNIEKQTAQKVIAIGAAVYRSRKLDVKFHYTLEIENEVNLLVVAQIGVGSRTNNTEGKIAS